MGTDLENFLSSVDYKKINRMWFDFKNLNNETQKVAKEKLERLDKIFNLKEKVILESSWISNEFSKFSDSGWHTSYYLPTGKIVDLLKENNKEEMENLAKTISKQIVNQKLKDVSFDTRLYSFVKEYLEPKISKDIVYHVWYGLAIDITDYKEQLELKEIYKDSRIKTFLCSFVSKYNL